MARSKKEWLQAIADRAKASPSEVETVLASHHIVPAPVLPSQRRLMLKEIEFSGVKDGVSDDGPFTFRWDGLGHGLWGMITDQNLRGKSSVMEIVRWLIRGRPSSNLQDDVRRWVQSASIRFFLDDVEYQISARTIEEVEGTLSRIPTGDSKCISLATFSTEREFEVVMADFFMRTFSMEAITNWREGNDIDEVGQAVTHGWVAFSGAMFIGTNYEVLLGDLPVGTGLNGRLLQMYLGVPWVSTLASAKSAKKAAQNAAELKARRKLQGQQAQKARVAKITAELTAKRAELAQLPSDQVIRDTLAQLTNQFVNDKRRQRELEERLERQMMALQQAESAYQEDRRDLQTHLDSMAAGAVFRVLDPQFCPRCDHSIDESKKKQEKVTQCCSVCGESISTNEDANALKNELEGRVKASKAAVEKATSIRQETYSSLSALETTFAALQQQIDQNTTKLESFHDRQQLVTEVAVLDGRLQEAGFDSEPDVESNDQLTILNAIEAETEGWVKGHQEGLLRDVSSRLVHFAQRFGMHNLSDASLKGNGNLSLVKGGVATSYSKVTEGEKLRLKVATVLAMIEVAEQRGIGRHPGLLMIDSPAAHEVSPEDLAELVSGLQLISQELPHLQVFVAGLTSTAITTHIPSDRRREATNSGFLW